MRTSSKARLAPGADTAGYVVFKLGGAGALLGLAVGLVAGSSPALETWLAYSLSVAVAGAVLGSLAWVGQAARTADARRVPTLAPQIDASDGCRPGRGAADAHGAPASSSAFRAGPNAAR